MFVVSILNLPPRGPKGSPAGVKDSPKGLKEGSKALNKRAHWDILENFSFIYILLNVNKFNHSYLIKISLYRYLRMFYYKYLQHRPLHQAERYLFMKYCMDSSIRTIKKVNFIMVFLLL